MDLSDTCFTDCFSPLFWNLVSNKNVQVLFLVITEEFMTQKWWWQSHSWQVHELLEQKWCKIKEYCIIWNGKRYNSNLLNYCPSCWGKVFVLQDWTSKTTAVTHKHMFKKIVSQKKHPKAICLSLVVFLFKLAYQDGLSK